MEMEMEMENENLNEMNNELNDEKLNDLNTENLNEVNNEILNKMDDENLNGINNVNPSEINTDTNYKEVLINKMIIDGKEQENNFITIDATSGKQEINVTVYTQDIESVLNKEEGKSTLYEWIKKGIFRNKRK